MDVHRSLNYNELNIVNSGVSNSVNCSVCSSLVVCSICPSDEYAFTITARSTIRDTANIAVCTEVILPITKPILTRVLQIYPHALGGTPVLGAWLCACAASVDNSRLSGNVRAIA